MNYRTQHTKQAGEALPPDKWVDTQAPTMQEAAVAHLRGLKVPLKAEDYPVLVYVSDEELTHPNGAPICVHGYRFEAVAKAAPGPKAADILRALNEERVSSGIAPWATRDDQTEDISRELRRRGVPHSPAQYGEDAYCLTCGEHRNAYCPGVHTFEEIQSAARAAKKEVAP